MRAARGLDHLVHLVRDLDAAGADYERLGFQVGAENRHPFGTKNRIIQFPGVFVELLAIGDHAPIPDHGPRSFSFGGFHRDRLARLGEGGSGVALDSSDAKADAAGFANAGIGDFDTFVFERSGRKPDGSQVHMAFELAFAAEPASPDVCFFTCEHKRPEAFWNPAAQIHPNGAGGVAGAVLTAENPSDHHVFLRGFTGLDAFRATSSGLAFPLPRGELDVLTGDAFARRYGEADAAGPSLRFAAIRIAMAGGVPERLTPGVDVHGLRLAFEPPVRAPSGPTASTR